MFLSHIMKCLPCFLFVSVAFAAEEHPMALPPQPMAPDLSDKQAFDIHDELRRLTNDLEHLQHQMRQMIQVMKTIPSVNTSTLPQTPGANPVESPSLPSTSSAVQDVLEGARTLDEAIATRQAQSNLQSFLPQGNMQADYDQLMLFINAKDYVKAENAARAYIHQYENDDIAKRGGLINKVYYWLADIQYQLKNYTGALASIKTGYGYPHKVPLDDKKPEYVCLLARCYYQKWVLATDPKEKVDFSGKAKAAIEEGLASFPNMDQRTRGKFQEVQHLLGVSAAKAVVETPTTPSLIKTEDKTPPKPAEEKKSDTASLATAHKEKPKG